MYYLKCNNCGHLNEVKTEYLSFCANCNKKLENNFSDWHRKFPEKSFEDYKRLICISEDKIHEVVYKPKPKSVKGLKYGIVFAVFVAIFYAIGQFGGEALVKFIKSEKTSKEVLSQKWVKETYGIYGLTVETPVLLNKSDLAVPDRIQQMIDRIDTYDYTTAKGFKIIINSAKYKPVIAEASLQGAANGTVNEMKMQKGVTDFNYAEEYITKDEIPGFIQKGTYKFNGIGIEFINAGFAFGLNLWQVSVIYQSDDEIGRIAAKRVIDSIEININSKSV
jgi:hypothetical protein